MARKAIPRAIRRQVRDRANNRCEYCLHPADYSTAPYVCEHIQPRVRGAGSSLRDLAWSARPATVTNTPKPTLLTREQADWSLSSTRAASAGHATSSGVRTSSSFTAGLARAGPRSPLCT